MIQALCRTLAANAFADRWHPLQTTGNLFVDASHAFMQRLLDPVGATDLSNLVALDYGSNEYLNTMQHFGLFRYFVTTEENYIGLAPNNVRLGDQVCALLGCKSPLVLRPVKGSYEVIGECYLDGAANGEAILGPLPARCKFVAVWMSSSQSWKAGLLGTLTGKTVDHDPRLDMFIDEGEATEEQGSSILTPDRLIKMGIKLTTFDLF
jgi:hypothetical protein